MTADEGAATLNPEAPDGSETQDPPATGRRRARSNGQPATTYAYNVYLDGAGVEAVGTWEAENAATTLFCSIEFDGDGSRHAHCIDGDDLRLIATVDAATNDKAVAAILQGDPGTLNDRAKVVRETWQAHVDLEPIAIPVSRVEMGRVPCPWRIEHTGLIGGTR